MRSAFAADDACDDTCEILSQSQKEASLGLDKRTVACTTREMWCVALGDIHLH